MNFKNIVVGLLLLLSIATASASQTITVYWPFGIGDPVVTNLRALFDKANQIQNEYNFLIVAVPGAGGAIAARKTITSQEPAVLATTSAFFVRPMLFSDSGYTFDEFKPSLVMSSSPFALVANNKFDNTWSGNLSIGIAGIGSTTHIIGEKIKQQYPKLTIVPYKGLSDSTNDVIAGHVNLSFNLIRAAEQYPDIKILGITGTNRIKDYKLLRDIGIQGVEHAVINVVVVRPGTMSPTVSARIDEILKQANDDNPKLMEIYKQDSTTAYSLKTQAQRDEWYQRQIHELKKLTKGIKIVE